MLQGPNTTSDTFYNMTGVGIFNENLAVRVVPINGNARGGSATKAAVIGVSQNG